jgi:outer membrane lipase/esterase
VDPFVPQRVIVFGDEQVTLESNGDKYGVNALTTDTPPARECRNFPLWTQSLAAHYGFVFPQCNPTSVATTSRIYASATNNTVAGVEAQITSFLGSADQPFASKDLVIVSTGTQDIVDALSAPDPNAAVEAAATALALQINRVVNAGAKVVFTTVPNVGLSPWGRDASRSARLSELTILFNRTLRSRPLINDGRRLALVDAYEAVRLVTNDPALQGFANVSQPLCTGVDVTAPEPGVPSTACTTATLESGADVGNWLWADSVRLGPVMQGRLGNLAVDRVRNHPF